MEIVEISFLDIEENEEYINTANKVVKQCFTEENLINKNLYVNIVFTNPENIKKFNNQYRNINKETDVLSFPMFEKEEFYNRNEEIPDVL